MSKNNQMTEQFPVNLLVAGVIVVLAWILNLSVICAMRSLSSNSRIIYGFLSSLCVANLFLATINFPPSILSKIIVSPSIRHALCVSWAYIDTLLCNTALLHVLGSSLDSYLRLRHPHHHHPSVAPLPTCLKLSAPWTLAFLQATAFMAIAKLPPLVTSTNLPTTTTIAPICTLPDPNFLILRSIMCFGLPVLVSAILVFLAARGLHSPVHLSAVHYHPTTRKRKNKQSKSSIHTNSFNIKHNSNKGNLANRRRDSKSSSSIASLAAVINGESAETQNPEQTAATTEVGQISPITSSPTRQMNSNSLIREETMETIAGTISPTTSVCPLTTASTTPLATISTQELTTTLPPSSSFITTDAVVEEASTSNYVSLYQHSCPRHGILSFSLDKAPHTTALLPLVPLQTSQNPCQAGVHSPDVIPQNNKPPHDHTIYLPQAFTSTSPTPLTNSQSMDLQRLYAQLQQQQHYNHDHRHSISADYTQRELSPDNQYKDKPSPGSQNSRYITHIQQHERIVVAINLTLCIFSIVLWGPYIVGSLIRGVCKPPMCILPISSDRMIEFKWLSYIVCIVYPILFVVIDVDVRHVIKQSLIC